MVLWRLYRSRHGPGLGGAGGLYVAGRWHEIGTLAVYLGASPAIVVLEKLAHINPELLPDDLLLSRFEAPLSFETVHDFDLEDLENISLTRARGEAFLRQRRACVLRVPSVVLPEETNLLLNPAHPDAAGLKTVSTRPFRFDSRLLERAAGKKKSPRNEQS